MGIGDTFVKDVIKAAAPEVAKVATQASHLLVEESMSLMDTVRNLFKLRPGRHGHVEVSQSDKMKYLEFKDGPEAGTFAMTNGKEVVVDTGKKTIEGPLVPVGSTVLGHRMSDSHPIGLPH